MNNRIKKFNDLSKEYQLNIPDEDGLLGGNLTKDIAKKMFAQMDITPREFAILCEAIFHFSGVMCSMVEGWVSK